MTTRKIEIEKLKMQNGYVLLKPDDHYETYQFQGRETGILASNTSYMNVSGEQRIIDVSERNFAVRATVVAVPSSANWPDKKFHSLDKGVYTEGNHKGNIKSESDLNRYAEIEKSVCRYHSEIELSVGDRVFTSWMIHHKDPQYLIIDGETYIKCKYDELVMVLGDDNRPKRMLNGWVLYTIDERGDISTDSKGDYVQNSIGLFIPVMKEKSKEIRKGNKALATCHLSGTPNKNYKDFPNYNDFTDGMFNEDNIIIKSGEKMIVDKRGGRRLEPNNHREYEEKFYITHRKFIDLTERTASSIGLDINKAIKL